MHQEILINDVRVGRVVWHTCNFFLLKLQYDDLFLFFLEIDFFYS